MASKPGGLSLEEVLRLQRELYAAYSDDEFQAKLEEVESKHGKAYQKYTSEHTRLFLSVQDRILPKYGFAQGQKGAVQMLDDVKRFNGSEAFEQNRLELNRLIGLAPEAAEEPLGSRAVDAARPAEPPARGPPAPPLPPAPRAELEPPAITELLRWQPRERRGLRPEVGAAPEALAAERPSAAGPKGAGGAGAAPRGGRTAAQAPAPVGAAAATRGPGSAEAATVAATAAAAAGQDVGAWLRSLDDPGLAQYEPFVRRLVGNSDEIKRKYPLLQDFFAAVPVNDPRDRQAFARAIRILPEPS